MAIDEARAAQLTEKVKQRDAFIRESWIRAMEARIVRENLKKCYRVEGVNHLENCKDIAERYSQMLRDNRVQGFKQIDV